MLPREASLRVNGKGSARLAITPTSGLAQVLSELGSPTSISAIVPMGGASGAALSVLAIPSLGLGSALERLGPDDVVIIASGL